MTNSKVQNALEKRFRSYNNYVLEKIWYSAAVCLAEIFNACASLPVNQRAAWNARINNENLSEEILHEIRAGLDHDIQRMRRILSIGTVWTGEEVLLLVLLRTNVDLLSAYLGSRVAVESMVHLEAIDEQLLSLSKSTGHRPDFIWAVSRIRRSSGFPIETNILTLLANDQRH